MAHLRKKRLKEGHVFVIDYRKDGKRHVRSTRTSNKALAKRIFEEFLKQLVLGNIDTDGFISDNNITLAELIAEYKESPLWKNKSILTKKNQENYFSKLTRIIGEDTRLRSINSKVLRKWVSYLMQCVKPTTFNIERRALHTLFNVAVKEGYIIANPFKDIPKIKVDEEKLEMTKDQIKIIIQLIFEDIKKVEGPQKEYTKKFLCFVLFLLNTGMRRSEALSITKSNIDFHNRIITLVKTKSKKLRYIPMNDTVLRIVKSLDDELFSSMEKCSVTHKFHRYVMKAGLAGFRLHSLRHTFASLIINQNYDIYTVRDLLGHQDIRTTMVYAKHDTGFLRQAVNQIEIGDETDSLKLEGGKNAEN